MKPPFDLDLECAKALERIYRFIDTEIAAQLALCRVERIFRRRSAGQRWRYRKA